MKKTMFYLIVLSLMGCSKTPKIDCDPPTNDLEICKKLIIGEWQLERTSIVYRGVGIVIKTKKDYPKTVLIVNENMTYRYYENDKLMNEDNYSFYIKDQFNIYNLINFKNGPNLLFDLGPINLCSDSLFFNPNDYQSHITPNSVWHKN
jgi:hypothetical protein